MTLVSVVTPSFNQSAFLTQTMLSVLEQDHPEIEYMVVDGGSIDGSVDVIRSFANRLAWWVSEKDGGQAEAINKGISRARGEILAWVNSDDFYLPGAVSSAVRVLEANPQSVLVYANMLAVDERGQIINSLKYRQLSLEELLTFQIIGQPAAFMRREVVSTLGGLDTSMHYLLDHHLWIRLAQKGQILHANETWAAARYHPAAKNRSSAIQFGREAFRILKWASLDPELAPVVRRMGRRPLASAHRLDARYLLDGGKPWAALQAWIQSLWIHPPTALARMNLAVSALLELTGLGALRRVILRERQRRLSG